MKKVDYITIDELKFLNEFFQKFNDTNCVVIDVLNNVLFDINLGDVHKYLLEDDNVSDIVKYFSCPNCGLYHFSYIYILHPDLGWKKLSPIELEDKHIKVHELEYELV